MGVQHLRVPKTFWWSGLDAESSFVLSAKLLAEEDAHGTPFNGSLRYFT
jgi:hypothetical protein